MENKVEQGLLERVFHLKENHTDVKAEIITGITTFMTMACILTANSNILSATGMDRGAVFTATALAFLIATLLVTASTDYPFVLTPGMGLNAYFAYTVMPQIGYSWEVALAAIFVEGPISIALSLASVREAIFNTVPVNLKYAVSAGIGLPIAFIGLQNVKIIVESVTLVPVFSLEGSLEAGTFSPVGITALLTLVGMLATSILVVRSVKGNVLWGILITQLLDIICEVTELYQPNVDLGIFSVLSNFSSGFGIQSIAPTFFKMDFSGTLSSNFITIMFAFLFVDMFGTLGTLIGVASKTDMLDKDGKLSEIKSVLTADAVGASLDAIFGTSITTTFMGNVFDVAESGRTGLTFMVTILFSGPSLFLSPIFLVIPSFATVPAPITIGFLMVLSILKIDSNDLTKAIPSYIVVIAMSFTYSISEDIAMGIISYVVINLTTSHAKERKINLLMYILAVLLVLKYVLIQCCAKYGEVLSYISAYSTGAKCSKGNFSYTKLEKTSQSMVRCFRT